MSTWAALSTVPAAAVVAGVTYATVAPASTIWGQNISRARRGAAGVAITFDDGPTPGPTDHVLDALAAAGGVKAAFFVIGVNVEQHPDLLRRIHADGHLVANHSYSHSHYTVFRRWPYWEREIRRTDEAIAKVIGVRPLLFRPPMGVKTWHTDIARRRTGHTTVTWSRRAVDGIPTSAEKILRRFAGTATGEILLLHDGVEPHAPCTDRTATLAAIPRLIEKLRSAGLPPVRLDELLKVKPYATT